MVTRMAKKPDLLPGTLDMLILKTLTRSPLQPAATGAPALFPSPRSSPAMCDPSSSDCWAGPGCCC
jgi:hypothetical protein